MILLRAEWFRQPFPNHFPRQILYIRGKQNVLKISELLQKIRPNFWCKRGVQTCKHKILVFFLQIETSKQKYTNDKINSPPFCLLYEAIHSLTLIPFRLPLFASSPLHQNLVTWLKYQVALAHVVQRKQKPTETWRVYYDWALVGCREWGR